MSKTTYIETELGLLPSDWKIRTLCEVAPLQRGFDLPASELKKGPYPVVYSNGILNYHHIGPCVAPGLVTGRSGTIGKFTYISEGRYWPHNTALWVTSFKDNCPLFVRYLFETVNFGAYSTGTGVPTLNRNDLHTCTVSLPPTKAEQTAIAGALSDIDSLIRNFDRTIAKKQNIRQGAMEQLLSGQLRLPGFKKKWVESELGQLGRMVRGVGYKPEQSHRLLSLNSTLLLRSTNVQNGKICTTDVVYVDDDCIRREQIMKQGDILICTANGSRELVGKSALFLESIKCTFGAFMGVFRCYDAQFSSFVYYLFQSQKYRHLLEDILTGSAINNLNASQIEGLVFLLPDDNEEIFAIADTLTAMDDEIAMLQLERDKYANIRAGMMDELLSGKKRLI